MPEVAAEERVSVGVSHRPEVSVIVPTNVDDVYLREAVVSVIEQTYEDWEVVVVVNGCGGDFTDLTGDPRIRVIVETVSGASRARNIGAFRSTGEFIAFLDHDDLCFPERFARQVDALQGDPDAGMSFSTFRVIDEAGRESGGDHGREVQYVDLLRACFGVLMSTVMVRRSVFEATGGFDPVLTTGEDLDFILRVAQVSRLVFVSEPLVSYRRHGGNASGDPWTSQWDIDPILRKHRRWARRQGRPDLATAATEGLRSNRSSNARSAYDAARFARKEGAYGAALRSAAQSLVIEPTVGPMDVLRYARHLATGKRLSTVADPRGGSVEKTGVPER